jgi:tRNA threonylcarbamoyladenosine biosynthesis protein TsaE
MLLERILATEADTERLGAALASQLRAGLVLFLHGELGTGKTTLVRGVLRGLGYTGAVKSPTYTLVEPYQMGGLAIYHFDLYRLNDPEELEFLGMRDYLEGKGVCLVEWAERGAGVLPVPDVDIAIERQEVGRVVRFTSRTENGAMLLRGLTIALDGGSAEHAGTVLP